MPSHPTAATDALTRLVLQLTEQPSSGSPAPVGHMLATVRQWAYVHLRHTTISNTATQWAIRCNRRGIDHTLRHVSDTRAGRDHARSMLVLADLLATAPHVRRLTNRDPTQQRSLRAVHHFEQRLVVTDQLYLVRVVVKEAPDGYYFYDHRLICDEPVPSTAMPYPHSQEGGDG